MNLNSKIEHETLIKTNFTQIDIERYLKDLEWLVNIDSGSFNIDGNMQIAGFFAERLKAAGYATQLAACGDSARPAVIAKTPEKINYEKAENVASSQTADTSFDFYLGGHIDTVFPNGTASLRPFRIDHIEGRAYGPGTVDMKAGALLILYIAEAMIKSAPHVNLLIFLNSDEEIGSAETLDLMRQQAALCKTAFIFEGGRKLGQFVNERKGIAKYKIQVEGKASHSGTAPGEGASAIVELANCILSIDKLKNPLRGTTVNVGLINGGTALNVVAPYSEALAEVRYSHAKELERVEKALFRLSQSPYVSGTSVTINRLSHYPPLVITKKTAALMECLKKYSLEYVKAGGISDANRLTCLDIPIIDGCGPSGGFPHNDGEYLTIETVEKRFSLMCRILSELSPV